MLAGGIDLMVEVPPVSLVSSRVIATLCMSKLARTFGF